MILILMGVWNELWKVKAPSKVLNLCWRALAECLPTKVQLRKRHVPVNVVCPVCNTNEETIFHALVSCPFAVQCWQRVISNTFIDTAASFRDWFSKVFKAYNKDKRSEMRCGKLKTSWFGSRKRLMLIMCLLQRYSTLNNGRKPKLVLLLLLSSVSMKGMELLVR